MNGIMEAASGILSPPIIALPLGVLASMVLFRSSRASVFAVDPSDKSLSLIRLTVSLLVRLIVAAALLAVYLYLAPESLPWFGAGLGCGFLILANVEMLRRGRAVRMRREHLVPVNKEG